MIIIDADSIIYAACFSVMKQMEGDEPPSKPTARVKTFIRDKINNIVMDNPEFDQYLVILSGKNNFRYDIYPDYKANRKGTERPDYYDAAKSYLIKSHNAYVTDGVEADDYCRIAAERCTDFVLAHCDKDLDQIPGKHYNFRTGEHYMVDELEGLHNLYRQSLTGDSIDNIPGLYKITGKKAAKAIKEGLLDCMCEEDCWKYVCSVYNDATDDFEPVKKQLITSMKCLYLLKSEQDEWREPCVESHE